MAPWEKEAEVYRALFRAAEAGLMCPRESDLSMVLDEHGDGGPPPSSTVLIVQRLERRGFITVRRYQRYREVTIMATGKQTAPAKCRTPHWRERVA